MRRYTFLRETDNRLLPSLLPNDYTGDYDDDQNDNHSQPSRHLLFHLTHPRSELTPTVQCTDNAVIRTIQSVPAIPLHMTVTVDENTAFKVAGVSGSLLVVPRSNRPILRTVTLRSACIGGNDTVAACIFVGGVSNHERLSRLLNLSDASPS
jgi:hypothetical protein